jgi:hypothetical protein
MAPAASPRTDDTRALTARRPRPGVPESGVAGSPSAGVAGTAGPGVVAASTDGFLGMAEWLPSSPVVSTEAR